MYEVTGHLLLTGDIGITSRVDFFTSTNIFRGHFVVQTVQTALSLSPLSLSHTEEDMLLDHRTGVQTSWLDGKGEKCAHVMNNNQ